MNKHGVLKKFGTFSKPHIAKNIQTKKHKHVSELF